MAQGEALSCRSLREDLPLAGNGGKGSCASPLCEQFHLDSDEIQDRRAFLGLSETDQDNLQQIQQVIAADLGGIVDEFYAHLAGFEHLRPFTGDPVKLARLKKALGQYLLSLGRGADQSPYFEDRLRIGITHERVGLKPKWYLGAYAHLFGSISRRLSAHAARAEQLASWLGTLQKVFTLDATLVIETYYQSVLRRLEELLRIDWLTQVSNRKSLLEGLEAELHRSQRFGHAFSLLFVDLDHFKRINDRHGHRCGDVVLRQAAGAIRKVLRSADILGRYGGEEFLIGLVETDANQASQIAERIRAAIAHTNFGPDQLSVALTASIGLAALSADIGGIDELIEEADRALYTAKRSGRNRVCANRRNIIRPTCTDSK